MKEIFLHIWYVLQRELKRMVSRPLYLTASIGVFLFCMFFFMTLMEKGAAEKMPMAVVDLDQTSISRRVCHEMQATPSVDLILITNSYSEAREAMQQGYIYGILVIPQGFYSNLASLKRPRLDCYYTNAYTVGGTTVYKQMLLVANLASGAFQREVLRKKGMPDDIIMNRIQPIAIDMHMLANPWGNYTIYLVSTIMPGILGLIAMMLTIFAIGFELKSQTSHEWLRAAGGDYTVAMIGKLLPYTVIYLVLGIVCHLLFYNIAGFPVNGSHERLLFGMLLFIMAMEAMGIVLIGLLPTLRDALSIGALYGMLGFSLSGFTYPNMGMMPAVRALSNLEPLRHYYLIYVDEALMGAPSTAALPDALALVAFFIPALCVAPRLHRALVYQNYPLK
ncbi:MAG: ABC transporter permease [Paludibacteraceae bacterium]|nr:ABC transporter permease [Paludibacteraceae bacterium]MBR4704807.1 ABC transporter permease [Paludibacteraceae bacterium]